jgi:hypothetical protein
MSTKRRTDGSEGDGGNDAEEDDDEDRLDVGEMEEPVDMVRGGVEGGVACSSDDEASADAVGDATLSETPLDCGRCENNEGRCDNAGVDKKGKERAGDGAILDRN